MDQGSFLASQMYQPLVSPDKCKVALLFLHMTSTLSLPATGGALLSAELALLATTNADLFAKCMHRTTTGDRKTSNSKQEMICA